MSGRFPPLTSTTEVSEAEVRKQLTLREEQEQEPLAPDSPERCTRTKFLLLGMDIERTQ